MESKILAKLGIDPAFIFLFMLILIVVLFVLYVNVSLKYDRLKNSYASFMRGKMVRIWKKVFLQSSRNWME